MTAWYCPCVTNVWDMANVPTVTLCTGLALNPRFVESNVANFAGVPAVPEVAVVKVQTPDQALPP